MPSPSEFGSEPESGSEPGMVDLIGWERGAASQSSKARERR